MIPIFLAAALVAAAAEGPAVATLAAVAGPVEIVRADSPAAAAAPAPLEPGDLVRTGPAGRARIEWPGGASLDVGPAVAAWEAFEADEAAADERVEGLAGLLERLAPLAAEGGGVGGFTRRLIRGLPLRWR